MITPELVSSWNRKISIYTIPFEFVDKKLTIPEDWDVVQGEFEPEHISVTFQLVGTSISKDMAVWADDNIDGYFTYRDWTKSSLPFIDEKEIYWSGFTFQKLEDAEYFIKQFKETGINSGNWMDGHEDFIIAINKLRDE